MLSRATSPKLRWNWVAAPSGSFWMWLSSGRPSGRYHPWAQVDPTDTLDTAGMGGNNIELNRFDWVKLQD